MKMQAQILTFFVCVTFHNKCLNANNYYNIFFESFRKILTLRPWFALHLTVMPPKNTNQ